jgi:hypothetical protein
MLLSALTNTTYTYFDHFNLNLSGEDKKKQNIRVYISLSKWYFLRVKFNLSEVSLLTLQDDCTCGGERSPIGEFTLISAIVDLTKFANALQSVPVEQIDYCDVEMLFVRELL